jgi:hypothetical protein
LEIEMCSRPLGETVPAQERVNAPIYNCGSQPDIPALNALAMRSLALLFQEKKKLFSRRLTVTEEGLCQEESSPKRTIIALLGLQRAAESGVVPPFDVTSIRDVVLRDTSWVRSVGDLGLLTWFTAECFPGRLGILFNEFDFGKALEAYSDGRQACTMGLSWFLTGIARARLACDGAVPDLTDMAVDTFHLLQDNQGESGIFGHAKFSRLLSQAFWNRFGTFADQIYAIYALTTFARAFQIEEPLASALACANSVRSLQGEEGQWWFLYNKRTCRVVNQYPVMSLHQDGTAPLALFAVEEITGQSFHDPVYKGLSWVTGANELGEDLRNLDQGLIWDSISSRKRIPNYWEGALSCVNGSRRAGIKSLRIRYEARPDHFGWLLYAFGRFGLPRGVARVAVAGTGGGAGACFPQNSKL